MSVAPGERHDLVGGHGDSAAASKAVHELLATCRLCGGFADDQGVAAAFHFDLGTGADTEFIAQVLGNGELTLCCDAHDEET
jgi:hypothetical protein